MITSGKTEKNTRKSPISIIFMVLLGILLIVYLFFSNQAVSALVSENPLEEVDFSQYQNTRYGVYHLYPLLYNEENFEIVEISGWALCESTNSDNKTVSLILKGKEKSYASTGKTAYAADAFYMRDILGGGNDFFNHSYSMKTSLLMLPDGDYEIYVYCRENDEETFLADTGRLYRKEHGSFSQIESK